MKLSTLLVSAAFLALGAVACGPQNKANVQSAPTRFLSNSEIRQLVKKHFSDLTQDEQDKMYCIAYAESTFNAYNESGVGARGLFQIMRVHTTGNEVCNDMNFDDMWNPDVNATCAARLQKTQGFDAWDPYYFAQRAQPGDANYYHAVNYLKCRRGEIGWGE